MCFIIKWKYLFWSMMAAQPMPQYLWYLMWTLQHNECANVCITDRDQFAYGHDIVHGPEPINELAPRWHQNWISCVYIRWTITLVAENIGALDFCRLNDSALYMITGALTFVTFNNTILFIMMGVTDCLFVNALQYIFVIHNTSVKVD